MSSESIESKNIKEVTQLTQNNPKRLCNYHDLHNSSYNGYVLYMNYSPRRLEFTVDFPNGKTVKFFTLIGSPSEIIEDFCGNSYDIFDAKYLDSVEMHSVGIDRNHYDMVKIFCDVVSIFKNGRKHKTRWGTILMTEDALKRSWPSATEKL